jgi:hypothetical protein
MSQPQESIAIVMATCNGAEFLDEQLQSIYAQTQPVTHLLVRDDGSTDRTPEILAEYAARRPDLIRLVSGDSARLGPCGNFASLLELCDADYVLLADQDDRWLPDKVARTLARMKEAEHVLGQDVPLLVHTDLIVADERLRPVHPSLWKHQRLDALGGVTLPRLLVQNTVTGCTALVNRALVQAATPIPAAAVMHDWWLALVAAAVGHVICLPEPTVLYRQHAANRIGASGRGFSRLAGMGRLALSGTAAARIANGQRQAAALLSHCDDRLSVGSRTVLEAYAHLAEHGPLTRRRLLLRHGLYTGNWLRNVGLFALV